MTLREMLVGAVVAILGACLLTTALFFAMAVLVECFWNTTLVELLRLPPITYWQAFDVLCLLQLFHLAWNGVKFSVKGKADR
jgi:hypothetical protein